MSPAARLGRLVGIVSLVSACGDGAEAPERGAPPVPVKVATAVHKEMPVEVRAVGTVEPTATVAVSAQVSGKITAVHFQEGSEVRQGDLLFSLDGRPYQAALAEAEAQLRRDRALAQKADDDLRRYTGLVEKEYVSREQFDTVRVNAEAQENAVLAGEAAAESARLRVEYTAIRAPISGRTGSLLVHAGNMVRESDPKPLVVILQTRPIRVAFSVSERHLAAIRARQAVEPLAVAAAPAGGNAAPVTAQLEFIDNAVNPTTGMILLKASYGNDDGALWPGQFVEVVLTLSREADAVVVPSTAIQDGQQGRYVFVVKADNTAEQRPVVVARTLGADAVLSQGVAVGETVVTDGHLRLLPGSVVAVAPATGQP